MTAGFACPECGSGVRPGATPAGRRVVCPGCGTLVEVPFLPRSYRGGRSARGRSTRMRRLGWWGLGLASLVVAALGLGRLARDHGRRSRASGLAEVVGSMGDAERGGNWARALTEAEAALSMIRDGAEPPRGLDPLSLARRRDRFSIRDLDIRLAAAVAEPEAARAVGECLTLWARAATDPALADRPAPIAAELVRRAEAELMSARSALAAAEPAAAFAAVERAMAGLAPLPASIAAASRDAAAEIATRVVDRHGIAVEGIRGTFTLGTPADYEADLVPLLAEAFRRTHRLGRPRAGPFRHLWDERAPARLRIKLDERREGRYEDTPHHYTRISAELSLESAASPTWQTTAGGRTRRSLGSLGVGRAGMQTQADDSVEHRLYDDARQALMDQIAAKLRELPGLTSG